MASAGDDSYSLSSTSCNFVWDGAGVDTLDASSQSQPVTLYLEPGDWGYIGSKAATITEAAQVTVNFGTIVENLTGGSGNDFLCGNSANNSIKGNAGDDTLNGGEGIDQAVYARPQSYYTVTQTANGFTVKDNVGTDGTDTLVNIESLVFADAQQTSSKTVNVLAYSWKAHTLLDGVNLSNGTLSGTTNTGGAASFSAVTESSLTLSASRAIPTAEASDTSGAVNLQDAIAILRMIVGLDVNGVGKPLSPYQSLAADFDGNGTVGLTDAIGVLKHVVGLTSPEPAWHFLNEADKSIQNKTNLTPGVPVDSINADLGNSSPAHVGLVGYLSGDVDGSYAGAVGALDLDATQTNYFQNLAAATGFSLSQFGM